LNWWLKWERLLKPEASAISPDRQIGLEQLTVAEWSRTSATKAVNVLPCGGGSALEGRFVMCVSRKTSANAIRPGTV
jgi:hypothetical protein